MSTGENIQFLRKREGYTQEGFAEQMGVSRQTISKWESDSCFPEMEKLLQMCDMFRCNLDDLVRGDVQADIAMDTAGYDEHMNWFTKKITVGVVLVLLGVCVMLLVYGLSRNEPAGGLVFFLFLIVGTAFLITGGMNHGDYVKKHPHIVPFYSDEEQENFQKKFVTLVVTGISLILFGVVCLIGVCAIFGESYLDANDYTASLATSGLMFFVTAGTAPLVYGGIQKSKYDVEEYNRENAPDSESEEETKAENITGAICGSIMLLAAIIFLLTGFIWSAWHINWVAFVAGGLLCAIVSILGDAFEKNANTHTSEKE